MEVRDRVPSLFFSALFHCLRVHAAVGPVPPVLFHGFFRYVAYVSVQQVPGATGQLPTRSFPVS